MRGLLRGRALHVAVGTTSILGQGAVKDTYNLVAAGIRQLLRTLARLQGPELSTWAELYAQYLTDSPKGAAETDWD